MTEKERLREILLEQERAAYSEGARKKWRRAVLITLLIAALAFLMEFGQYLPFYPRDAYISQTCTFAGYEYGHGRDLDRYSRYVSESGESFRLPASWKDGPGRVVELDTLYGNALRKQYELPRSLLWHILIPLCLLVAGGFEILWYVRYRRFRRYSMSATGTPEQ